MKILEGSDASISSSYNKHTTYNCTHTRMYEKGQFKGKLNLPAINIYLKLLQGENNSFHKKGKLKNALKWAKYVQRTKGKNVK